MLYLEIKKWKEAIKASDFQHDIGGADALMKINMKSAKGCGQLSLNGIFLSNIWFSKVKTAEEENSEGLYHCRPEKTSQNISSYINLEESMK